MIVLKMLSEVDAVEQEVGNGNQRNKITSKPNLKIPDSFKYFIYIVHFCFLFLFVCILDLLCLKMYLLFIFTLILFWDYIINTISCFPFVHQTAPKPPPRTFKVMASFHIYGCFMCLCICTDMANANCSVCVLLLDVFWVDLELDIQLLCSSCVHVCGMCTGMHISPGC